MVEVEVIGAYLRDAGSPVTLKKMQQDLRTAQGWSVERLAPLLKDAESAGVAFAWPRYRRSSRYWHRDPAGAIRERVLEIAGETALPKRDLVARTARQAHNSGKKAAEEAIAALVREGSLKSAKTVGSSALYYKAGSPRALVDASMALLMERLKRLGAEPVAPDREPAGLPHAGRILAAIRPGVPVTVQSLRAAVPDISKADFDAAVLALADQHKIYLTTHDHGWALPEEEREQLVWDGAQKLYVAVTLRD